MKEEIKTLALEIKQIILNSKRILMHLHPNPDEDSVGSVLALAHVLKRWGKDYLIISGDSHTPDFAQYLPGGDEIVNQTYLETDVASYDLHIVLDTGGVNQITKRGTFTFPAGQKVVVIDHHATNNRFGTTNLIVVDSPSTTDILYRLFKEWEEEITSEIAICLFVGLYGDTGGFQYPKTTAQTFLIAADLVNKAPDFSKTISNLRNNEEKEKIIFQSLALSNIEDYAGGKILIAAISREMMNINKIKPRHTENNQISAILRSIKNCEIGISLIEDSEGTRVSFRSKDGDKYDVSQIAFAFGGGGHKPAAACHLKVFLPDAKKIVLDKIAELYPELA